MRRADSYLEYRNELIMRIRGVLKLEISDLHDLEPDVEIIFNDFQEKLKSYICGDSHRIYPPHPVGETEEKVIDNRVREVMKLWEIITWQ